MKTSHKPPFLFCTMWLVAVVAGCLIGSEYALGQTDSCGGCWYCLELEQVYALGSFIGYTVKGTTDQSTPQAFGGGGCGKGPKGYISGQTRFSLPIIDYPLSISSRKTVSRAAS
jgi:hypothetical protein